MDFIQAVNEVVSTTKRPDLIGTARREVNSAISFYCLDNHFKRDFIEQQVTLNPTQYSQSFNLSTLTRFRDFSYIKRAGTKAFLKKLDDASRDSGCFVDKYYIAGSVVNINMSNVAAALDIGYYAYPPILDNANKDFWLLEIQPFMVVDRACATMFRGIGDEKSMQAHATSARETYLAARKDLINN